MSDNKYQEVIKNNKLFDGIPPQDIKLVFNPEQVLSKNEGEIIFQKGDESLTTFLILKGIVKTKVYIDNKSVKLNKSSNDFFGEIEVLEDTFRRSAAVANTDCTLYAISKSDLRSLLTEHPEINDNIIAYNKVDIPELQITIAHQLLEKDTDKIYVPAQTTESPVEEFPEEETEEKPEETVEQNNFIKMEESEEIIYEEPSPEKVVEEPVKKFQPETLKSYEPPVESGSDGSASAESLKEEEEKHIDVITEDKEEVDLTSEDISAEEDETDFQNSDLIENETSVETENETEDQTDLKSEDQEENNLIQQDNPTITDEVENDQNPEKKESEEVMNASTQTENFNKQVEDDHTRWINLNSNDQQNVTHPDLTEEEKQKYEAMEERLKYDDTEINTARILEAILKINSGFDEQTIHSNIIRETVKLTDAQAGILYTIDSHKNLLKTQMETEDGFVEVTYPLGNGLTGLAAETGEIINVREPSKDFRFSEDVDSIHGIAGSSLLCVPITNDDHETIAVLCLANSGSGKFLISDEEILTRLTPHISQTLQRCDTSKSQLLKNLNNNLSTFTKFITDNIETPVLTMKYYAGQIKKKDVPADVKTVLNVLMDQADSVVNFLHSAYAYTEDRNPLQVEQYKLREVMDETLGLLAEYVESRNVGLYKKVESEGKVNIDKKAFYQACLQIAKNACDAMGENGNIYITAKQSGDLIDITFRDTGPGIPDDIKHQIFLPFKSFNKKDGTGLGLTIAQRIIRDHGGELTVESNPEQGATFIISLPCFEEY